MSSTEYAALRPAEALTRLLTGYQVTQLLYVMAKLGIADLLEGGPKASTELAEATEAHAPSLYRLLRALSAFGLLDEVEPDRFALTPLGQGLRTGAPGNIRALALMHGTENFWRTWGELYSSVRTGEPVFGRLFGADNMFDYYAQHPEIEAVMGAAMTAMASAFAPAVIEAGDFSRIGTLVDVGGGRGYLLASILQAHPRQRGILFDLPHVVQGATAVLQNAAVDGRCEVQGGSMFASVPGGGDAYVLSRVLHDWDDEAAAAILAVCHAGMASGAKLLLIERVLFPGTDRSNANQRRLLMDLHMLLRTHGRERSLAEYRGLMERAGFQFSRVSPTSTEFSIVEGVRP